MKTASLKNEEYGNIVTEKIYFLPRLPYSYSDLEPLMSEETLAYHHGKHHSAYIEKLNKLISKKDAAPLEDLIKEYEPGEPIFNNAAQAWNHQFFWNCLRSPNTPEVIPPVIKKLIEDSFKSVEDFKKKFAEVSKNGFGSGWTWLEKNNAGKLEIKWRPDAETPIQYDDRLPILVCDFWEHAYYIDHRNDKDTYLHSFWDLVSWGFVAKCYSLNAIPKFDFLNNERTL